MDRVSRDGSPAGSALARLIDDTERRNQWTDRRIVAQATRSGHKLTTSDMTLYRQRGMRTLVPAKVRALAAGMNLPAALVAATVLEDLGIPMPLDVRSVEDAIRRDPELSARTRQTLLLLVEQDRQATT